MSSKDFETALIDMMVAYLEQQKTTKKKKEILQNILERVSSKKTGGAGGDESATDTETEDKPAKEKRAPTAYNLFMKDIRPLVAEKNPAMKQTEITTEIGRLWNIKKDNPDMSNEDVMAEGYPVAVKASAEKKLVVKKK
jgi:hypothetical protein